MQGSLRIGLIPHLPFAVLIIVRYRCLRLLSDLLVGAGVSAVGTTLLQSPGWNEGKARYETLGKHVHKNKSSIGAALQREHLPYVSEVPPLWGSINMFQ